MHKESRASVDYEAQLGPSHKQLVEEIFRADSPKRRCSTASMPRAWSPACMAIFEPRIEQFSFAIAKETGGVYCAVTIRYQILIYAPNGELVDTLTLTGYGSGPAPKIGNGEEELGIAAYAAMRDAAAKFLTQFHGAGGRETAAGLAGAAAEGRSPSPGSPEAAAAVADMTIEAVPINDPPVVATTPTATPRLRPALRFLRSPSAGDGSFPVTPTTPATSL